VQFNPVKEKKRKEKKRKAQLLHLALKSNTIAAGTSALSHHEMMTNSQVHLHHHDHVFGGRDYYGSVQQMS